MRKIWLLTAMFVTVLVFAATGATARADTLTMTLESPDQTGYATQVLSFYGTISTPSYPQTENVYDIYRDSDAYSIGTLSLDDTGIMYSMPSEYLNTGMVAYGLLFQVTIPSGTAPEIYNGWFEFITRDGSATPNMYNYVNFSVNVQPSPAAVPEPSSLLLICLGLVAIAVCGVKMSAAETSANG